MTLPPSPFTLNRKSPQARGLMAWLPTSTDIAPGFRRDCGLYGWNLAGVNSPTPVATRYGIASEHVAASTEYYWRHVPVNFVTYPFTLTCWFRATSIATLQAIIHIADDTQSDRYAMLAVRATGDVIADMRYDSADRFASYAISADTWYHAVGVFTSATLRQLYVNGVYQANNTVSVSAPSTFNTISMGYQVTSSGFSPFGGTIGDCRIYNRALSAAEIWHQYAYPADLYAPVGRVYAVPSVAASTAMPMAAHYYRMRRAG